ncbi:MAG: PEGA domain-containing protein [Ignavibacteriales bacterium]|nr:MAG: PEGA domain-containing protein [Ignavibacteriales bacterium]
MKSLINYFLVIVISFSCVNLLAQDCETKLIVNSDYQDTHFYLNDTLIGTGNKIEIQIEPGVHVLLIMENSDRWDAKSIMDTINVARCQTLNLSYKLRSDFLIQSNPSNAEVLLNDTLIGYTPLRLKEGYRNILLRKEGYESQTIGISDVLPGTVYELDYIGMKDEKNFFQTDLFKIMLGGIVVLGGTSAYFKIKADEKFEDYEITGNGDSLKETRKYDLISGLLFGALQINFGFLIYHILIE